MLQKEHSLSFYSQTSQDLRAGGAAAQAILHQVLNRKDLEDLKGICAITSNILEVLEVFAVQFCRAGDAWLLHTELQGGRFKSRRPAAPSGPPITQSGTETHRYRTSCFPVISNFV